MPFYSVARKHLCLSFWTQSVFPVDIGLKGLLRVDQGLWEAAMQHEIIIVKGGIKLYVLAFLYH